MNPVFVRGVGLWTPGFGDAHAWCAQEHDAEVTRPSASILEGALRRRATALTRMGVEALQQAAAMSGANLGEIGSIWATAHGEHATAIALLRMMHRGQGKLSPTHFHNSVHNTASGYASIAAENKLPSTTLTGGAELVASTLLEAATWLNAFDRDVAVVLADEPLMAPFEHADTEVPLALSLLLSPREEGAIARLGDVRRDRVAPVKLHDRFGRLHVAAALPLVERIVTGEPGTVGLELEEPGPRPGPGWCVDLDVLGPCPALG